MKKQNEIPTITAENGESDDEMMLDLEVDTKAEDAKDSEGGCNANPGATTSQASAGSGYESDLFEE